MDGCVAKLSSIMDTSNSQNIKMRENLNDTIEITPYAEMYYRHPHFILATHDVWKDSPSRADHFTGQSHLVIQPRRAKIRKSKVGGFRKKRRLIMDQANIGHQQLHNLEQSMLVDAPFLTDHSLPRITPLPQGQILPFMMASNLLVAQGRT